jgi:hypothetical protein
VRRKEPIVKHTSRLLPLLGLVTLLLITPNAGASVRWCSSDPIITITDGDKVKILRVHIYSDQAILEPGVVTDPTRVLVQVPPGYRGKTEVYPVDNGFGAGYAPPEVQKFDRLDETRKRIEVQVSVKVPVNVDRDELPILLVVTDYEQDLPPDGAVDPPAEGEDAILTRVKNDGTTNDWVSVRGWFYW